MRYLSAFLILLFLLALATPPAGAAVVIESLLVRRQEDNVNIRVTVRNPGSATQRGPIVIQLYVRANSSQPWQKIKTWNNIGRLPAGHRVSRDFFEENNALLAALAASGTFEVRAVLTAPGIQDVESTTSFTRQ
jgi:hypothetical protein